MTITSLEVLAVLVETTDVECKAAQGKAGKGEVPDLIWETARETGMSEITTHHYESYEDPQWLKKRPTK